MAYGSNNNFGKVSWTQFEWDVWWKSFIQTFNLFISTKSGLAKSETFPHNIDSESDIQLGGDAGNDVIGEPTNVIPNQQRYKRVLKASWKIDSHDCYITNQVMASKKIHEKRCLPKMRVDSIRGTYIGCKNLQKSLVKVFQKISWPQKFGSLLEGCTF